MTKGRDLSPTIYNVVVYAVLWHWFNMVAATEGTVEPDTEGLVQDIQKIAACFYYENGLLVSTRATQLQLEFDVLMDIFVWVELPTNVVQTVIMVCQPCCTIGGHSAEAYGLSMEGEGITYRDRLRQRVCCPE